MSSEVNGLWELTDRRSDCSLSGVRLEGEKLVRFIYADESGISVNEPIVVVAGIVVNPDLHQLAVEDYINTLIEKHVPEPYRYGFVFHAKDLFHGSGRIFDKRQYPLALSHDILKRLLEIPSRFQLPIVCGHLRKRSTSGFSKNDLRPEPSKNQAFAFSLCALAAESYMKECAEPSELATMVPENNNETRRMVKVMHDLLRGARGSEAGQQIVSILREIGPGLLPIRRIRDTVFFADKDGAFLLQLADACALVIRYFFNGRRNADEFIDVLTAGNPSVLGNRDNPAGYRVVRFEPL